MNFWDKILNYYKFETNSNRDFIVKLHKNINYIRGEYNKINDDTIVNNDLKESNNYEEILEKYINNNLITTRLGCIESKFLLYTYFETDLLENNLKIIKSENDYYMKKNAGLYYKNIEDKDKVINWWIENTLEIIKKSTLTSAYCFLHYDLLLWSYLDLKYNFYNWGNLHKLILKNSKNKKILYIGNGTKSISYSYNNKIYEKGWNFEIPKFELYCLKTPQTTKNMNYPDDNMIITTNKIIEEIENSYGDFDTAILGCGAYGPPITNILSKKFSNKNLIYLGSSCYYMFCVYSKGMPIPNENDVNKNEWIEVLEDCDPRCKDIDQGKYWKT